MFLVKVKKNSNGQAIVEFSIILPFILLVIVGGIIDFGFAFNNMLTLQRLANDTALWAAESNANEGQELTSIQEYAEKNLPDWWTGNFEVTSAERIDISHGAQAIRVVLRYESPVYTPFYQWASSQIVDSRAIPLSVSAAYQIPNSVYTR